MFIKSKKFYRLMSSFIIFSALLTLKQNAQAVVVEHKKLSEIKKYIDKDTLVFFDIDNTLLTLPQYLGTPEWSFDRYKTLLHELSEDKARTKSVDEWKAINAVSKVQLVEKNTAKFVRNLQKKGIVVIGLTARPTDVYELTKTQLSNQNIDFTKTALFVQSNVSIDKNLRYTHGIMFVNEKNKGDALVKFFAHFGFTPKKVIFVDDVQRNTAEVDTALTNAQIANVCVRYSATDEKVNAYNRLAAEAALAVFVQSNKVISNSEAEKLVNRKEQYDEKI